ncbi:uncharacterized protein LOC124353647 [Homalodisca vitripennis]|uniref:uncharacterized protein LOC124353647 n=1 Tax=Homalodisca vitripennis TaxID=197043 RepID=UPI001EEB052C|nr:uncharacterized protein LOC124353647 [Homalodisca vitripennis]
MTLYVVLPCVCLVSRVVSGNTENMVTNRTSHNEGPGDTQGSGQLELTSMRPQEVTRMVATREFEDGTQVLNETLGDFDQVLGSNETEFENITAFNNMLNDTWIDLITVLDLMTQRKYDNASAVHALTAAYRYTHQQQKRLKILSQSMKKPFIAVEGLDREKRNTLAKRLALHLQGYVVNNPPETFDAVYRNLPDNSTILSNGFYVLSTYIAALHVRYVTRKSPAIVPGFWLGRAAYMIAKNFPEEPPPYKSKFWTWPRDLLKPSVIFYLTDRFSLHQFADHQFVKRYLHIFNNWDDPKCIPITNTQSVETMMEEIHPYLRELLL